MITWKSHGFAFSQIARSVLLAVSRSKALVLCSSCSYRGNLEACSSGSKILNLKMEKIIIVSFLFLACVVLESSSQVNTTSAVDVPSITPNSSSGMPTPSSPAPESSTEKGSTEQPTSGVVNVEALAGLVASFALIGLF